MDEKYKDAFKKVVEALLDLGEGTPDEPFVLTGPHSFFLTAISAFRKMVDFPIREREMKQLEEAHMDVLVEMGETVVVGNEDYLRIIKERERQNSCVNNRMMSGSYARQKYHEARGGC